jgi:Family of unknown function (DUF5684)
VISQYDSGGGGGGRPGWWVVLLLIPIVNIVVAIILWYELSVSFGHGVGFTIGLVLLNWIFLLILGFGSSRYLGPGPRGVVPGAGAPMPPPPV